MSLFDLIQNSFSGRGIIHIVFLEKSIESLEKLVEWEMLKKDRKKWKKRRKIILTAEMKIEFTSGKRI